MWPLFFQLLPLHSVIAFIVLLSQETFLWIVLEIMKSFFILIKPNNWAIFLTRSYITTTKNSYMYIVL